MTHMRGGSILLVDLTSRKISKEPVSSYTTDFIGGVGINMKFLYDNTHAGTDPLSPENVLVLGVGPLAGTQVPGGRTEVSSKSPENGFLGTSNFGGFFGPELKFAGYDNIVISGKADKPVYLWIYNDHIEIKDAAHLWGKNTYETQELLRAELASDAKVLCIGPAGEHLVYFASLQHELRHGAGRTGMGAVMGSKNLKAIAVRGTGGISLSNPEKYQEIAYQWQTEMRQHPVVREKQTYGVSRVQNAMHTLAEWNAKGGPKPAVHPSDMYLKYKPKRSGCFGCLTQCQDLYPKEAYGGGAISCSLYYGAGYVGSKDAEFQLEMALAAVKNGMDIVTSMKMIGWLMQLYEKGMITAADTDGIALEPGNTAAARKMFYKMVNREGIGDILANGFFPAVDKFKGKQYAHLVKKMPAYELDEPEEYITRKGEALALAMSPRGDSMKARCLLGLQDTRNVILALYDEETAEKWTRGFRERLKRIAGSEEGLDANSYAGKPELVIYSEDIIIMGDCLSACKLCTSHLGYPFTEEYQAALYSAGSGVETSVDDLFKVAKRVRTVERAFSMREGMTRADDSVPQEFLDKPIKEGEHKGVVMTGQDFEKMKDRYYQLRGWDIKSGVPTRETLEKFGLGYIADDLEKLGKLPSLARA